MYLTMTVTNGTDSETVTVPAVMGQKYETVITPTKDVPPSERTKQPHLNGFMNGVSQPPNETTVNGDLSLPAIPTVDSKTEVAPPPALSIKQGSEAPGQLNGQKGDLNSSHAFSNGHVDENLLPSTKLQRLLKETDEIIVCPGVYDGFSARIALSVGFKAMYMVSCTPTLAVKSSKHLLISARREQVPRLHGLEWPTWASLSCMICVSTPR